MQQTRKLPLTAFDLVLELTGWALLLLLWYITVVVYDQVPDLIPIHYKFSGVMIKHGTKITLLFYPATASVMFVGLTLLTQYPWVFAQDITPGSKNIRYSLRMIRWLKISIAVAFSMVICFIFLIILGEAGEHKNLLFPAVTAVICLPVMYYIYKILSLKKEA